MQFLLKNKIPRLHPGMSNAARFLFQSLGFNSFLHGNSVYQAVVLLFWNRSRSKGDL